MGQPQVFVCGPTSTAESCEPTCGPRVLALSRMVDQAKRSQRRVQTAHRRAAILSGLAAVLAGCASPGQPKPPSLHLVQVVDDLSAQRVGAHVHLHWTTPALTSDNLPVAAHLVAVICRQSGNAADPRTPCATVFRLPVSPGPSQVEDVLPPTLTSGPAALLSYRVEILNAAGRSAGRSAETFAASGAAPPPVEGLVATPVRRGVRLTWRQQPAAASIDLDRVEAGVATPAGAAKVQARKHSALSPPASSAETHLSAGSPGEPDAGGTIDRSVQKGVTYSYIAQRVQSANVETHTVTVRSDPSTLVTVKVLDTFPPEPPVGLEAAPGGAETPSIDLSWQLSRQLSWQPEGEVDLAGYNVYRADVHPDRSSPGPWRRLNSATVAIPAFEDTSVSAGVRYAYRITAVDIDHNESAPGNEVQETPGTR